MHIYRNPETLLKGFWFFDFFKYSLQKKITFFPLHSSNPLNVKLYIMFPTGDEALIGIQRLLKLFLREVLMVKWSFLVSASYVCTFMCMCTYLPWFTWQVFGSGEGYRGGLWKKVMSCPILDKSQLQLALMDSLLAKAELLSNTGCASVTAYFRKVKKSCTAAASEEWENMRKRENPADFEVSEEGGEWCAPGARAEVPLQPVESRPVVEQAVPLQSEQIYTLHAACGRAHSEAKGCGLEEVAAQGEPHMGASSWQELQLTKRRPHWSRFSGRSCSLWGTYTGVVHSWMTVPHVKNPCWSRSWRTAPFGKDPHCQFMMYPMGPLSRAGEEFEAEGSAESVMDWPQPPLPIPLCHSEGRR